jgi:predicted transcriptional regulator of viral defense system
MAHASRETYGGLGVALLKALAERGRPTFTVADAQRASEASGIAPSYLSVLLHRLVRAGLLQRIKRGTYTLAAGVLGFPEAHPFAVGMALVDPCAVSGWSALNHHGLTDQVPHVVTLTTPRRVVTPAMRGATREEASVWKVAGQRFEIVTVVPAHYFGHDEVWLGESRVRICDRERALLDCFALPRRFGGLAEGLGIIEEHLHEIDVGRLVAHAVRYGAASVAKRIGFALERAGVKASLIDPLRAFPMQGIRLLDPSKPARGTRDARWGLRVNLAAKRVS